jgi:hypothetical protein
MAKDELETVLDLDVQVIRNMVRTWANFTKLIQQLFLYFDTEMVSQKQEMNRGNTFTLNVNFARLENCISTMERKMAGVLSLTEITF